MSDYLDNYPPVLNIEETAEIMHVGKQLIRKEIAKGKIPAIKVGRIYRIPKARLVDYLNSCSTSMKGSEYASL